MKQLFGDVAVVDEFKRDNALIGSRDQNVAERVLQNAYLITSLIAAPRRFRRPNTA
jgi:hypothetical protein